MLDPSSAAHWRAYGPGPESTGNSRNSRQKLFLMWRVFLPLQGVLTAVWGCHCSLSQLAHFPLLTMTREGLMASRHTGFAARVSRWAVSPWDLQNLQCFKILLLSLLLSLSIQFLFCFLILTVHSNTQRSSGHQGRTGLAVFLCTCTCQDDHISSKTPTVDNNWSALYERKHGNLRTTFPCFSRRNRVNL